MYKLLFFNGSEKILFKSKAAEPTTGIDGKTFLLSNNWMLLGAKLALNKNKV